MKQFDKIKCPKVLKHKDNQQSGDNHYNEELSRKIIQLMLKCQVRIYYNFFLIIFTYKQFQQCLKLAYQHNILQLSHQVQFIGKEIKPQDYIQLYDYQQKEFIYGQYQMLIIIKVQPYNIYLIEMKKCTVGQQGIVDYNTLIHLYEDRYFSKFEIVLFEQYQYLPLYYINKKIQTVTPIEFANIPDKKYNLTNVFMLRWTICKDNNVKKLSSEKDMQCLVCSQLYKEEIEYFLCCECQKNFVHISCYRSQSIFNKYGMQFDKTFVCFKCYGTCGMTPTKQQRFKVNLQNDLQ